RDRRPATPQRLWSLLTNAADFPRWNSTVTRITGTIGPGERLALEVKAAPGRTFKPRVTRFEPEHSMVWSDGFAPMFQGVRTFTLSPRGDGTTTFSMVEVLSGVMLPMIKGSLPDFGPAFEAYAADLKREAERTA
ncbi:MAG: SRPBCC domain-containing protein, partial [Deltaproteobacteria bacterium]